MENSYLVVLVVVATVVFIIAGTGLRIIRPWQKGLIERLGKYQRTAGSGLTLIIPFLERIIKIDMREQVVDVPPQQVITKDNVAVERVFSAIHNGNPTNDLIAIKYLDALGAIANGRATKVFLPFEASGILGSIAGIGELLKDRLGGDGKSGHPGPAATAEQTG